MPFSIPFQTKKFWLFVLVLVPLYMTWTFDHSLWNPDETRDAGIASEMYRFGNFIVPKLNGEAFLEKPPLYYWSAALVYKLTGHVTAGTTRLPSALYGILGVLFAFLIGKHLFNERVGLFAGCILATSAQYFRMSHFAMMDVALAALVAGAFYFYLKGSKFGFLIFTILAFYTKGFLGVILTGMVVVPHLLLEKKPKDLFVLMVLGAGLFALLVFPWFYGLWKEGGNRFLEIFLIDNHWNRFFSKTSDHSEHAMLYYFVSFPGDFLPWTIFYAGHVVDLVRKPRKYFESKSMRFLLLWFFGFLLFFTVSSSKRSIYLLPLFPAAALLSAAWLDGFLAGKKNDLQLESRLFKIFGGFALVVILSSFFLVPRLDKDKTFVPVCDKALEAAHGGLISGYKMSEMERGVFGFYLKGPLPNPLNPLDLEKLLSENSGTSMVLIANGNHLNEIRSLVEERMRIVYEHRPDKKIRSYVVYAMDRKTP